MGGRNGNTGTTWLTDETSAAEMRDTLTGLQKLQLISLFDAAVVVQKEDGKVNVKQAVSLVGVGALGGAFWGMLIGLLFFAPWLGRAIGAATGPWGARKLARVLSYWFAASSLRGDP